MNIKNGQPYTPPFQKASADGALRSTGGVIIITKATAGAFTLARPTMSMNGQTLIVTSTTAAAHVIVQSTPGFNNGGASADTATFAASVGSGLELVAADGAWWIVRNTGITLS